LLSSGGIIRLSGGPAREDNGAVIGGHATCFSELQAFDGRDGPLDDTLNAVFGPRGSTKIGFFARTLMPIRANVAQAIAACVETRKTYRRRRLPASRCHHAASSRCGLNS
jgi:hypothetical protein